MAQEPDVKIGTALHYSGHDLIVTQITHDGVMVLHQGQEFPISRKVVEDTIFAAQE